MTFLKTISTQDRDIRIRQLVFTFAADNAASDTRSQDAVAMVPSVGDFSLYKIWIVGDATVEQNASNYATFTFKVVRAGESTTIGSCDTTIASGIAITANKAIEMVDGASTALTASDVITWEVAKTGDGVSLPSGTIVIEIENSYSYVG